MITGKDKSKILIKHISCKCKYVNVSLMVKNVTRIKSGITINVGVSAKNVEKHHVRKKRFYLESCYVCL